MNKDFLFVGGMLHGSLISLNESKTAYHYLIPINVRILRGEQRQLMQIYNRTTIYLGDGTECDVFTFSEYG